MISTLGETTELVGRARELARIAESVARGDPRIVLAGLTGMGKTALLRAALATEPRARVVTIAGARSIEDVHVAIADAIGARLGATTTAAVRRGALGRALRRRGVDVLGFDAADDAIAVLDDEIVAMRDEGGLRVALLTVRTIPAWPSATLIEVGPLATAARAGEPSDAATLFAAIVRRARPDYDVANELAAVERVVGSVDGVPAAIAILAGRRRFLAASDLEAIALRAGGIL